MRPLAVIGNLSRDIVGGRPPRVGGAPFHAGRALRLLGREARIVTKCTAADKPTLLPPVVALGMPVSWRPASSTASFSFRYDGDVRIMTIEALGEPWTPDEAWPALEGCGWVQVGALARSDFPPATLAALARRHRLLLDGQGLVRPSRTGPLELDADFDPDVLRHVTVLKLAEEEAVALVGGVDPAAIISLGAREVVLTLGSRGALVCWDACSELVRARPAASSTDATGAGDAFSAAYIAARSAGVGPVPAARRACALVGTILSERGA